MWFGNGRNATFLMTEIHHRTTEQLVQLVETMKAIHWTTWLSVHHLWVTKTDTGIARQLIRCDRTKGNPSQDCSVAVATVSLECPLVQWEAVRDVATRPWTSRSWDGLETFWAWSRSYLGLESVKNRTFRFLLSWDGHTSRSHLGVVSVLKAELFSLECLKQSKNVSRSWRLNVSVSSRSLDLAYHGHSWLHSEHNEKRLADDRRLETGGD